MTQRPRGDSGAWFACRGLALAGLLHDPDNNSGLPGGGRSATAASLVGISLVGYDEQRPSRPTQEHARFGTLSSRASTQKKKARPLRDCCPISQDLRAASRIGGKPHALQGNDDTDRQEPVGGDQVRDVAGRSPLHRLSFQISEAARLMVSASTAVLKKNEMIACRVASRRKDLVRIVTSEVCEAAPKDVAK